MYRSIFLNYVTLYLYSLVSTKESILYLYGVKFLFGCILYKDTSFRSLTEYDNHYSVILHEQCVSSRYALLVQLNIL